MDEKDEKQEQFLKSLTKGDKVHWERVGTCALATVEEAADPEAVGGERALPEICVPGEARLRSKYVHLPEGCTRPVASGARHS